MSQQASKGIDCSAPMTAAVAKQIAAAGYQFAARYLVPQEYKWKRLTRAEAEVITAAGMQIVSVFETTANRAAGGVANGKSDGAAALQEAKTIGQPEGSAIYFAVDYDAQANDYDAIEAYLKAAAAAIPGYEAGVYGSYAVIEEMARRGVVKHFWQTYAWSRGKQSAHANIYQHQNDARVAGATVDLNKSFGGEGWWDTKPVDDPQPTGEDTIKVVVNGKLAAYGRLIDGHVYLPLRKLGEAFGMTVSWDNTRKVPYINGHAVGEYKLINNTAYVGVRASADLFQGVVSWDGKTKNVYLLI